MKRERVIACNRLVIATAFLVASGMTAAAAAEIKVLSAGAVRPAVAGLAETFRSQTGHEVRFTFGTVGSLQQKVTAGEKADLFFMTDVAIDDLVRKGIVVLGTRTDIARVEIGIGVREGSPKPDISTPEALKQTLLSAKSLVYMDPAKGGTSGIHFASVLDRLGITDAVKPKTTLWPAGYAAEPVAKGEIEIVVHQISEILAVKGVTLVGPLPHEVQKVTIYSAGLAANAASPDAAKAFLEFLTSPQARLKFSEVGLDYRE